MSDPSATPRARTNIRTTATIGLIVLATGLVVGGWLMDLSIVLVWPLTFGVVLIGLLLIAVLTRRAGADSP